MLADNARNWSSDEARNYVVSRFSVEALVDRLETDYQTLLNSATI